uniref:SJCHGC03867 protein n=1 Tax=Schistosoma japonicum TaxID=6182 RepID=Q5DBS9_SCHJA|nr:SJCHGC03867 protein [Schistosoma japonicum]
MCVHTYITNIFSDKICNRIVTRTQASECWRVGSRHNQLPNQCKTTKEVLATQASVDPESANEKSCVVEMARDSEINRLRAERLQRERKERDRAAILLAKSLGLADALKPPHQEQLCVDERNLPFNSGFNPELSAILSEQRQRHRDSRKRRHKEVD